MSYWHFTANDEYEKVVQLGSLNRYLMRFRGGYKKLNSLPKNEQDCDIKFLKNFWLHIHPVTLDNNSSKKHFKQILNSLKRLNDTMIIFTSPNADTTDVIIRDMINDYVKEFPDSVFYGTMGQEKVFVYHEICRCSCRQFIKRHN